MVTEPVGIDDVIASQIRKYRKLKDWSVRELADECARRGAPHLTAASLGNIERGQDENAKRPRRRILVGELLVLATALEVPPLALLVPFDGTRVTIGPDLSLSAAELIGWFDGTEEPAHPLPHVGFLRAAGPIVQYSLLLSSFERATMQDRAGDRARRSGDDEATARSVQARDESLRNAANALNALIENGTTPPAVPRRWFDLMTARGWVARPDFLQVEEEERDDGGSDQED